MTDWRIVLEPAGSGDGGTLEILDTDEEGAVIALEGWAETIESLGFVPEGLDWLNRSGASVRRRVGRRCYSVRVDSFERETDAGMTSGAGYLRAVEDPS